MSLAIGETLVLSDAIAGALSAQPDATARDLLAVVGVEIVGVNKDQCQLCFVPRP